MFNDEREDERRHLQQAQSLPLTRDGALDINGFHLRVADHRRLACELIKELVETLLPSPEQIVRARFEAAAAALAAANDINNSNSIDGENNNDTNNDSSDDPFLAGTHNNSSNSLQRQTSLSSQQQPLSHTNSLVLSSSTSSVEQTREQIRTRTRTIKITNNDPVNNNNDDGGEGGNSNHNKTLQGCFNQMRPFLSQLLLYPDCCEALLQRLGDLFETFVRSAATVSDCEAIVQSFVKWISTLILRFSPDLCLRACELGVIDIRRRAQEMKITSPTLFSSSSSSIIIVDPVIIAEKIVSDIQRHLEDESEYYPAARVSLARLQWALNDSITITRAQNRRNKKKRSSSVSGNDTTNDTTSNSNSHDDEETTPRSDSGDDDDDDQDNQEDIDNQNNSMNHTTNNDPFSTTPNNDDDGNDDEENNTAFVEDDEGDERLHFATSPFSFSDDDNTAQQKNNMTAAAHKNYDDYFVENIVSLVLEDSSSIVRKAAIKELTMWLEHTDLSKCSAERALSRAKTCLSVVLKLEKECRNNNKSSGNDDNDEEDSDKDENGEEDLEQLMTKMMSHQQDAEEEYQQRQQNNCLWNSSDSTRFLTIPLLLRICKITLAKARQQEEAATRKRKIKNMATVSSQSLQTSLLSVFFKAMNFCLCQFPIDQSWRVRHQTAVFTTKFAKLARSATKIIASLSSSLESHQKEREVTSSLEDVKTNSNNSHHHHHHRNVVEKEQLLSLLPKLISRWISVATVLATDAEPTIRQAIASKADEIFLEISSVSSSNSSTPSSAPPPSSLKILPIMLALAKDNEVVVRQAIVKPFFRTWNELMVLQQQKRSRSNSSSIANNDCSATTNHHHQQLPMSPTLLLQQKQLEEVETYEALHALLIEEKDEQVRVTALESLECLGSGLLEKPEILNEVVRALCAVVAIDHEDGTEKTGATQTLSSSSENENAEGGSDLNNSSLLLSSSDTTTSSIATTTTVKNISDEDKNNINTPFSSLQSTAGKWQVRRLAARQIPLLIRYLSFEDFSAKKLWACVELLLHDATSAVRDEVVQKCLPQIVAHYGASSALNMTLQWLVPLCNSTTYSKRRTGFIALSNVLNAVPELEHLLKSDNNNNNNNNNNSGPATTMNTKAQSFNSLASSSTSSVCSSSSPTSTTSRRKKQNATVNHLLEIAKEIYFEKLSKDKVLLVREAVEQIVQGDEKGIFAKIDQKEI